MTDICMNTSDLVQKADLRLAVIVGDSLGRYICLFDIYVVFIKLRSTPNQHTVDIHLTPHILQHMLLLSNTNQVGFHSKSPHQVPPPFAEDSNWLSKGFMIRSEDSNDSNRSMSMIQHE